MSSVSKIVNGAPKTKLLYQYLSTNGDGTGTTNANGDYSSTADQFYIAPAAGEVYHIARMIVCVTDTTGFAAAKYGNISGGITNGVVLQKRIGDTTVDIDITAGLPITTNSLWAAACYDADLKTWGVGNELLAVRWTFDKTGGDLRLTGDDSDRLTVILNDDLTGLLSHYFFVQGYTL